MQLIGHERAIHDVAFTSENLSLIITASEDNNIYAWKIGSNEIEYQLDGHQEAVNCLCFLPKKELCVSGSNDRTIRVWNITEEDEIICLIGHEDSVNTVCASPD